MFNNLNYNKQHQTCNTNVSWFSRPVLHVIKDRDHVLGFIKVFL